MTDKDKLQEQYNPSRRNFIRKAAGFAVAGAGLLSAQGCASSSSSKGKVKQQTAKTCLPDECLISGTAAANLKLEVYDRRFHKLVGKSLQLDTLFDKATWSEGPAWLKERQTLIFSDVKKNVMYRWNEKEGVRVFRSPSNFANGNAVDPQGNLITAEHGRRGISRTDMKTGKATLLVDKLEGRRLNSPNGVAVRSDGTIWFSDPPYGILSNDEGKKAPSEIVGCYIYCYNPHTDKINIATFNIMRPNGLAFSPDEKTLYAADMSSVEFKENGLHELVAFDVEGTRLNNRRLVSEISPGIPDGVAVNKKGVIFCSCDNGLIALLDDGTELGRIILGKTTSNCTFGNDDNTMFITAGNSVYRLQLS